MFQNIQIVFNVENSQDIMLNDKNRELCQNFEPILEQLWQKLVKTLNKSYGRVIINYERDFVKFIKGITLNIIGIPKSEMKDLVEDYNHISETTGQLIRSFNLVDYLEVFGIQTDAHLPFSNSNSCNPGTSYKRDYFGNIDEITYIPLKNATKMFQPNPIDIVHKKIQDKIFGIKNNEILLEPLINKNYSQALRRLSTITPESKEALEVMELMLINKVLLKIDINAEASGGNPLYYAAKNGSKEMYKLLIKYGATENLVLPKTEGKTIKQLFDSHPNHKAEKKEKVPGPF